MSGRTTLTMIKPEAVQKGYTGGILKMIQDNGFEIIALKMHQLSKAQAEKFYAVHQGKPFYDFLVNYMSEGPIVAAVLRKDNAVEDVRALIGKTNPEEAAEGTIRKKYAESTNKNAVHGSDSDENAKIEADFHFDATEIFA